MMAPIAVIEELNKFQKNILYFWTLKFNMISQLMQYKYTEYIKLFK